MNPLLLPPRLVLRALDDLHALASAAPQAVTTLRALEERAASIEAIGGRVLEVAERLEARVDGIHELGGRLEVTGTEVVEAAAAVRVSATEVSGRAAEVVAALPLLQRAIEMSLPLEGAVERLGRIVDRLPGGPKPTTPPAPAVPKPKRRLAR